MRCTLTAMSVRLVQDQRRLSQALISHLQRAFVITDTRTGCDLERMVDLAVRDRAPTPGVATPLRTRARTVL